MWSRRELFGNLFKGAVGLSLCAAAVKTGRLSDLPSLSPPLPQIDKPVQELLYSDELDIYNYVVFATTEQEAHERIRIPPRVYKAR